MTSDTTRTTYFFDRWRAAAMGVAETAAQTFLLLIAVRVMHAGPTSKALLASGPHVGFMLSLLTVAVVSRRRWLPSAAASWLAGIGAASFLLAAVVPAPGVFVLCSVVSLATTGMMVPLLTQIYEDNYPAAARGRLFSRGVVIRVLVAALFSQAAGRALSADVGRYRWLLCAYAAAFAFAALCAARMPSRPLARGGGKHPLRAMRFLKEDRLFRVTLICWMFMGFANLMMVPMRVEYLANPRYRLDLSPAMIAVLVGVVPNTMRLILSPVWGRLFDRMDFFALRVALNMGFAVGIVTFFTSDSLPGLLAGAVAFGIANAGGDVVWMLWVTKFAPPDRVAEYMSVHTFFTGLRGIVAPFVAFYVVAGVSMAALGIVSAGLIVAASAVLAREIRFRKAPDPDTELVERAG